MAVIEAYVTNLGKYNEGELASSLLKFPTTREEVQEVLKQIGIDNIRYEEIFIADYGGDLPELNACLGNTKALTSSTMGKRRKKGEGSVRQRKDGRWEGRVVISYDEKGLPRTKNVLAKTKRECQEKLKQLRETVTGSKTEKVRPEMPFGEWLDFWYQNYVKPQIRPTTQANYEAKIYQHIIPELGKIPLNQLAQKDLQQFYARMKTGGRLIRTEQFGKGLSDSMVRGLHAACRSALEKAVQEGLIRTNPAVGCKLPPKRGREMQVLGREELQRFLIQAQAEGYFELFLLDLCTGLRRGELLALQWDDLDFKTGTLTVNKQVYEVKGRLQVSIPKTRASIRRLVLPPGVVEVLRQYRETVDSRWMFPSPVKEDMPMTPGAVRRRLQIILERAGCKRIRFHDLRHPYVKHTTKIFSLRLMDFQAQAYPDARRKTRGACQLHRGGQSQSPVRPLCNRKRFS